MELSFGIITTEADRLFARAPHELTRALELAIDDGTKLILREVKLYPPKRSTQTYRRTLTLKRSWHIRPVRKSGYQVIGEVVSSGQIAPYNVYVQQASLQAAVHRGRWPTEVQIVERVRPHIVNMGQVRINRAVAALGR